MKMPKRKPLNETLNMRSIAAMNKPVPSLGTLITDMETLTARVDRLVLTFDGLNQSADAQIKGLKKRIEQLEADYVEWKIARLNPPPVTSRSNVPQVVPDVHDTERHDYDSQIGDVPLAYVIIFGNPVDAFAYVGTFPSREEADAYASQYLKGGDWWIVLLDAPHHPITP